MNAKFMLIVLLMMSGGCHDDHDQDKQRRLESELKEQRERTGEWMVVAGALGISCTVLFGIGTAVGSHARRKQVRKNE